MERAVLYLRLSKEDERKREDEESESIENQRSLLREYAHDHGFTVVKEYADEDYSGLYDDRPGFRRMIKDAKKGIFDVILAKNQSRFSRNMQHVERYLHREFPLMGIRFIGVVDGVDTASAVNKKARQIYGLVNEWYCEDLSESVRAVLHRKIQEGQFIGSFAPYGYIRDPQDPHRLMIDSEQAEIVRMIFERYAAGSSMRAICRELNERGISPPGRGRKRQPGKNGWNGTTIKRMLTNEVYLGHILQGKSTTRSFKNAERIYFPRESWVCREHMHPPVVPEDLFAKVRERLNMSHLPM